MAEMREWLWRTVLAAALCLGVGECYRRVPQEIPLPDALPAEEPFADIAFGERWYDGAQYGYRNGLVHGMTETEFGGELPATRAMAATMVWRMAEEPEVLGDSVFQDVEPGKYYTMAVVWGESRGLWEGYGDGTFRPQEAVTWGQLELVLGRYRGEKERAASPAGTLLNAGVKEGAVLNRGELAEALMEEREKEREGMRPAFCGDLSLPQ